jgi:CrcB protein
MVSIAIGAALGALLRWALSVQLNALFPRVPPGTLASNIIGGYLIGLAIGYLALHPELPPQWRLFVITGFLGGLTTFSTFSAEVVLHLTEGRIAWALGVIAIHVLGSVTMTLLGLATVTALRRASGG